ncbi:unnamed protein product, partial [Mesorhabditis spiculigera]
APHWDITKPDGGHMRLTPIPIKKERFCDRIQIGNLVFSNVAKSMSRQMRRIFCELNFRKRGWKVDANTFIISEKNRPACIVRARRFLRGNWWKPKNKRIILWRDPVDRFVSMYGHLCHGLQICGKAAESVHTAAKSFYKILKDGKYPAGVKDRANLRHHIVPTTWYCGIGEEPKKYIPIEYTLDSKKMISRLRPHFRHSGISGKWIDTALSRLLTTNNNKYRKLPEFAGIREGWMRDVLSNRTTMSYIIAAYYYDYRLFGKPLPKLPPK